MSFVIVLVFMKFSHYFRCLILSLSYILRYVPFVKRFKGYIKAFLSSSITKKVYESATYNNPLLDILIYPI
jgi:hypothetical protein